MVQDIKAIPFSMISKWFLFRLVALSRKFAMFT